MLYLLYVLKSLVKEKKYYIGYSANLQRRVREHNSKSNPSTKYGVPWRVCYYEAYESEELAREREVTLKKRGSVWQGIRGRLERYTQ